MIKEKSPGMSSPRIILYIIVLIISTLLLMIGLGLFWMLSLWSGLAAEEVVYHLVAPIGGTGKDIVLSGVLRFILPSVLALLICAVLTLIVKNKMLPLVFLVIGAVVFAAAAHKADRELGVSDYIRNSSVKSDFIADNYVDPGSVDLTFPERKRNLIYIYLESMETTYADREAGGWFEDNYIPELTKKYLESTRDNQSFELTTKSLKSGEDNSDSALSSHSGEDNSGSAEPIQSGFVNGAYTLPGSTWTIGGLFASTAGLPLRLPVGDSRVSIEEGFFPGMLSLGDILKSEGYRNVFLMGSKAGFGGRDLYFSQHGDYELRDYSYAVEKGDLPVDYYEWWGYEDAKLYEFAKKTAIELSKGDEPFNLTLLTADTHFPEGYECSLCREGDADSRYGRVLRCADRQIGEFIDWIRQQDFYEDTAIIIQGDHLTMDGFCDGVDESSYERKAFVLMENPKPQTGNNTIIGTVSNSGDYKNDKTKVRALPGDKTDFDINTESYTKERCYSTFDLFPTTLSALGVDIPGGRLALGTDLFFGDPTLIERYGYKEVSQSLQYTSDFLTALARIRR